MNAVANPPRRNTTRTVLIGLGLLAGGVVGYLTAGLGKSGLFNTDALGWSDLAASGIAVGLIAMGLIIGLASFSAAAAGKILDPGADRPATPAQTGLYRQQAVVTILAGAMMAAPVLAVALFDPLPVPVASIVMLGIVAAFLAQTVSNLILWRRADELVRRVMAETGAVCFWVLQGLLFLWAAAEKLNLAPPLTTWDVMTILMGFYLAVSSLIAFRRGVA